MLALAIASLTLQDHLPPVPPGAEAVSLLGRPLPRTTLPESARAAQEALLAQASADGEAKPKDPDPLIWVGRRQAYLGRYRDAIATFSEGIRLFPGDPRFLRHRGHRYITIREFDRAAADLNRAWALSKHTPDATEPDGLPNAQNIPTSTLHFNILYHLGLAHFLAGRFADAETAYRQCLAVSKHPDSQVATRYWLYLALRKLSKPSEATATLQDLPPEDQIVESHSYLSLLKCFAGDLSPLQVEKKATEGLDAVTVGYGLAMHAEFEGRRAESKARLELVLHTDNWAPFGYLAAEAELKQMQVQ